MPRSRQKILQLGLFMTFGGSLESWESEGILARELELYREHVRNGLRVVVISYGGDQDRKLLDREEGVELLTNRFRLPNHVYAWLLPLLHRRRLMSLTAIKTNQIYGAHVAQRVARVFGIPIIVRGGYGYSEFKKMEYGPDDRRTISASGYERKAVQAADRVIVTTKEIRCQLLEQHACNPNKVSVIPNYVVQQNWFPRYLPRQSQEKTTFAFFGRFEPQKNLKMLILAAKGLNVKLLLIGDGSEKQSLVFQAKSNLVDCEIYPRMSQNLLPNKLRDADFFVLPSKFEGHPKALLESMDFGIPVLVAESPGIKELVENGVTGLMVPATLEGLRHGLIKASEMSQEMRLRVGASAHNFVSSRYSVAAIAEQERSVIHSVCSSNQIKKLG